jgi:two-component system LytT family response regulator
VAHRCYAIGIVRMTTRSRLRVVLADDEPLVRERLRTLLASRNDYTLVAECADGANAVATIESARPDLVLLDVQMPELDGFEVLEAVPEAARPAVVFVTAYDQHAVRAFEVNAVDYLLKPIEPARFTAALDRVAARFGPSATAVPSPELRRLLAELRERRGAPDRFIVRDGHRITFVPVADVDWIEAAGNYVRLHAGARTHLLRDTMASVEARLDPDCFARVHRSAIVSLDRIVSMAPYFHGEYVLSLRDGTRLTSSRSHSARLRALLR